MQFFLHYLFRGSFYSVSTHRISLLTRSKSIFSCVSIQEDILSNCQDTRWFFKDNTEVHIMVNYFNSWWTDGKDEYFNSLSFLFFFFLLQASVFPQAEPFGVCGRVSTCSSLLRWPDALRTGWWDHSPHHPSAWKDSIDLFCYKVCICSHMRIYRSRLVFSTDGCC